MKKLLLLILLIIGALLYSDCEILKMKNFEIDGDTTVNDFQIYQKRLFVLDTDSKGFEIYDLKTGELKQSYYKDGKGPGEFLQPSSMHFVGDSLIVLDMYKLEKIYFSLDGSYIKEKKVDYSKFVSNSFENQIMKVELENTITATEKEMKLKNSIIVRNKIGADKKLHEYDLILSETDFEKKTGFVYTFKENFICITGLSLDKIFIQILNKNGDQVYQYSEEHKRVKKSEDEIEELDEQFANSSVKFKNYEYNYLLNNVFIFNNDNLFVSRNSKNGKELVILKTETNKFVSVDFPTNYVLVKLYDNYLYALFENEYDSFDIVRYEVRI